MVIIGSSIQKVFKIFLVSINKNIKTHYFSKLKDSVVTGLDCNPFCESFAINRLNQSNLIRKQNIELKDYLLGYAENMSNIRSNSVQIVIITDFLSYVENANDILKEIYRILKNVCIFNFFIYNAMKVLNFRSKTITAGFYL